MIGLILLGTSTQLRPALQRQAAGMGSIPRSPHCGTLRHVHLRMVDFCTSWAGLKSKTPKEPRLRRGGFPIRPVRTVSLMRVHLSHVARLPQPRLLWGVGSNSITPLVQKGRADPTEKPRRSADSPDSSVPTIPTAGSFVVAQEITMLYLLYISRSILRCLL